MNLRHVSAPIAIASLLMSASAALAVDVKEITSEFHRNQDAFVRKYRGQTLNVSGPLSDIRLEPRGTQPRSGPYLQMQGTNWSVTCYLTPQAKEQALSVGRGDQVTFTGTFTGPAPIGLALEPCTFK